MWNKQLIESKTKTIIYCLLVLFIWKSFENQSLCLFDTYLVAKVFSKLNTNPLTNITFLIGAFYLFCTIVKCYFRGYITSIFKVFICSFSIFLYGFYRNYYILYPENWIISYVGILILLLLCFTVCVILNMLFPKIPGYLKKIPSKIKRKDAQTTSSTLKINQLLFDLPLSSNNHLDILDYTDEAEYFAKQIERIPTDNHYSIGITAKWGEGKSSFLYLIEKSINRDKFIILKFNPRQSKNKDNIQEDFFSLLGSTLKKYNSEFSTLIKKYMKTLGIIDENTPILKIFNIYLLWDQDSEKKKLSEALKKLQKRILVIIDDLDRLFPEEIIEVLKLVHYNASFNNIIFITAYDKDLINDIIAKHVNMSNNHSFSDKFFSYEKSLPIRPYKSILNFLSTQLKDSLGVDDQALNFLGKYENIITAYLPNIREVKRFLNSFTSHYQIVKENVVLREYFLLFLIKYKYPDEYLNLLNREYIQEAESFKYYLTKIEVKAKCVDILNSLFKDDINDNYLSIAKITNFETYFYNRIYYVVDINELKSLFNKDIQESTTLLKQWEQDNKLEGVVEYIKSRNILSFDDKHVFENYIKLIFHIDYYTKYQSGIGWAFLNKLDADQMCKKYGYEISEYKNILISILSDNRYIEKYSFVLGSALRTIVSKGEGWETSLFTKEELQDKCIEILDSYCKNNKPLGEVHMRLFSICYNLILPNGKIWLDERARPIIQYMVREYPDYYFEALIEPTIISSTSNKPDAVRARTIYFQAFDHEIQFEEFLKDSKLNRIPNILCIRNFWRLFKNNDNQPLFTLKDAQLSIENNFSDEIQELDKLEKIEREYNRNKKNIKDIDEVIRVHQDTIKEINKVKINIEKKNQLISTIDTEIEKLQRRKNRLKKTV